ncbi:MAG: hypothetical protein NT029_01425 [Armatimonadetes bacterium]|nr:hypothetical protein [Armatimonadota bacterium]
MVKWTQEAITARIRELDAAGVSISYTGAAKADLSLLRAATRHCGSWRAAVEEAGFDYGQVRAYDEWTDERIVARIRELHSQGVDLSWRHVSTTADPRLAAAATKGAHFGSWRAAIRAAGIEYAGVRRYRRWDEIAIVEQLRKMFAAGVELNAKAVEASDVALITAARRRFGSWQSALAAAGIDYGRVALRRPYARRGRSAGQEP